MGLYTVGLGPSKGSNTNSHKMVHKHSYSIALKEASQFCNWGPRGPSSTILCWYLQLFWLANAQRSNLSKGFGIQRLWWRGVCRPHWVAVLSLEWPNKIEKWAEIHVLYRYWKNHTCSWIIWATHESAIYNSNLTPRSNSLNQVCSTRKTRMSLPIFHPKY